MPTYTVTGTGQTNADKTISASVTLTPPVPVQLGAVAWYNASQQVTQFNAARFVSASNQFLSLPAVSSTWLNGNLTKLSFELSFMLALTTQPTPNGIPAPDPVSSGLVGRWQWHDQGQFALDAISNLGHRNLRLYVADAVGTTSPPAVNGTALILPYHYYHLVVVFDGTQPAQNRVSFYLNGTLDPISGGNGAIPASLTSPTAALQISNTFVGGKNGSPPAGGDGMLDGAVWRVRFWPGVALTPSDARTLYNNRQGYAFQNIPATITAQPTEAWELNETAGNRASAITGHQAMGAFGNTSFTGVTQVGDLTGNGFNGVGIGSLAIPVAINGKIAFKFPGTASNAICDTMLDIGLPAGPIKPVNCTVAARCSTADITKKLNWIHASYYYPSDPNGGPTGGAPWMYLLNDINAWGGLILDDNHRLQNTQGTVATFYGNWNGAAPVPTFPNNNGNVAESQSLFNNNDPLTLIAVFNAGQPVPTLYFNSGTTNTLMVQSLADPNGNGGVYSSPPPTQAAGPAGNSFLGNMADPSYPGQSDHYIRDVSLYNYAMSPAEVLALFQYLNGA